MQFTKRDFEQILLQLRPTPLCRKLKPTDCVASDVFDKMPPKVQKYPEEELMTMSTLQFMMWKQKDFQRENLQILR